ncbi:MAG: carboxypeptidase regulatory-like domain-containing protein [Candidatus Rokubacteria bacterium]|nr:carboxypeptidase regulatory-like domain-containing protein [Candidatus Rokubacteria bacterium]
MPDRPAEAAGRRFLVDGGFAVCLLLLAILTGYGLLVPYPLRAITLASARQAANGTGALPGPESVRAGSGETWPADVRGRVVDADRKPLAGASVVANGAEVTTSEDGTFVLDEVGPRMPLLVKMPGYAKVTVEPTRGDLEVILSPHVVKAAYLTYYGVTDRAIRGRVLDAVDRTELNAVVIDVKGDRGWILYRTEVPLAVEAGAQGPAVLRDVEGLLAGLKARGIYTIARIVVFKDNVLASHRPDWAVRDARTGQPWIDNERLAWVDPFREEVWDYNIGLAREAVRKGFDEVQFDYVRFPTDGRLGAAQYAKPNNRETRLPAIAGFLARARRELGPMGAFVAADVFGYTAFNENDTDIGQRIEQLVPHLDYICPMVYPSGYHRGIPGYRNPVEHPYQVVRESVRLIRKRSGAAQVRVRPWIQDFRDYAFDRRVFAEAEIRAQIRGADDAGGAGWMLWNPRNEYTVTALRPEGAFAAR